jgi:hypothetical protein
MCSHKINEKKRKEKEKKTTTMIYLEQLLTRNCKTMLQPRRSSDSPQRSPLETARRLPFTAVFLPHPQNPKLQKQLIQQSDSTRPSSLVTAQKLVPFTTFFLPHPQNPKQQNNEHLP